MRFSLPAQQNGKRAFLPLAAHSGQLVHVLGRRECR